MASQGVQQHGVEVRLRKTHVVVSTAPIEGFCSCQISKTVAVVVGGLCKRCLRSVTRLKVNGKPEIASGANEKKTLKYTRQRRERHKFF